MVGILSETQNPWWRSAQAALMGASSATIVAGGLLGLTKIEEQLVHRFTIYSMVLGAGAGAVLGWVGHRPARLSSSIPSAPVPADQGLWRGWRNFVVERKVQESLEITSFYLKPQDQGEISSFLPGQFLTLRLQIPNQPHPVIRTYSLSDYAAQPDYYRLSIKREKAPIGENVPPGIASNFLHDHVHEGDVIEVKPPAGQFVLAAREMRPIVLLSNGVGITPMMSMVKAVSQHNPTRSVLFLHGARDGEHHAFREEIEAIAAQNSNLSVHYCYSRPRSEDAGTPHSRGHVDAALLRAVLSFEPANADYFICGSPAFMDAIRSGLAALGVPEKRVQFELFAKPALKAAATEDSDRSGAIATAEVVFEKSGKTAIWSADDGTLLEFAEAQGIDPPFSCRAGICLTCMCALKAGNVTYAEPPTGTPEDGSVLICVSKPGSSQVILEL